MPPPPPRGRASGSTTTSRLRWRCGDVACCPTEFADLEPFAETWCLADRAGAPGASVARARCPRCSAFYDAITPRAEDAIDAPRAVPARRAARGRTTNLLHLVYSMIQVSFPVECWRQPTWSRHRLGHLRLRRRTRAVSAPPPQAVVLRAARWLDVVAGEVRAPASIVVDGNRIVGGRSRRRRRAAPGDRPRRRHAPARPHGHGAQPPHRRTRDADRAAAADARGAGRPRVPDAARDRERREDAARRVHDRAEPRPHGQDRRLPARRRARARSTRAGTRAAHHPGRPRRHAVRRTPRPDGVPADGARDHAAERRGGHRQRRRPGPRVRAVPDSATAPRSSRCRPRAA